MAGWWQQFETDIAAAGTALEREHQAAIAAGRPWPPRPERELETSSAIGREPGRRAARIDELLSQAADAGGRLAADHADREARAEYTTRIEREAQAEPELIRQPQVPDQAEIEM